MKKRKELLHFRKLYHIKESSYQEERKIYLINFLDKGKVDIMDFLV